MLSRELLKDLQEYIDQHLKVMKLSYQAEEVDFACCPITEEDMTDFIKKRKKPTFNQTLFKYIDKLGLSDAVVYKKAGLDRRHFSKIRSNPDYHPKKNTTIALALALELSLKEAEKLLRAAGYTLSDSETFDLVITFCFERRIYDIGDVNLALDHFSIKPLGGVIE